MKLRFSKEYVPEWLGPAAYILIAVTLITGAMVGVSVIAGAPRPEAKFETRPRAIARAPVDTPETAPELSPIYPTTDYGPAPVLNNAARAREQARSGDQPDAQTTGWGWNRPTYSRNPTRREMPQPN